MMRPSKPPKDENTPNPPPGAENTGALVLVLLAVAAFCGWYIAVRERSSDTMPLPVVQKPLIPPSTTDTSTDLPGHKHYIVLGPLSNEAGDAKKP